MRLHGHDDPSPLPTEVTFIKKSLPKKKSAFCAHLVSTVDPVLAAKRAGYTKNPVRAADRLMAEPEVLEEVRRIASERESALSALCGAGYSRLAFGSVADAVSLLFMDDPTPEQLREMDLFLVSEIKKPKDGMLEIKFADRLKALEKLEQGSRGSGACDLFDAIGQGAKAVSEFEQP